MSRSLLVGLVVAGGLVAMADEPKPDPKKPMYERLLQGDDAKKAAELEEKIRETEQADKYDEAIKFSEELLALRTKMQGDDHWETVSMKWELDNSRKVAALPAEQRAGWRKARQGAFEAVRLEAQGQFVKAKPLWQEYHRWCEQVLGDKHPNTSVSYSYMAFNLKAQGKYADAQLLLQKALDLTRELLGEKHPDTAGGYDNLAGILIAQGKYADAQPLLQKALDLTRELLGDKNPDTATSYNNLAYNLIAQGKYADAQLLLQKALDLYHELLGEKHPDTATGYNNLAFSLMDLGKYAAAQSAMKKALDLRRELLGEKHPDTARSYNNLAGILIAQRKYADAQPLLQKALDLNREFLGEKHPDTARSYNNLAHNLCAQGKYAGAQQLMQKALDLRRELLGEKHPETATSYNNLAYSLTPQGKYDDAQRVLTKAAAAYEATRLTFAGHGLDRAVFGAERSPYSLLATTQVHLRNPSAAWATAENNLARGLSDELAFRRKVTLTPDEQKEQTALNARLNQLQPRILQLLSKQESTDREKDELTKLQVERRTLEAKLAELAVTLSQRELSSLPDVQAAIPADAALVLWVDVSSRGGAHEHWGCVVRGTGEPNWEHLPGTGTEKKWIDDDSALPTKLREALASRTASPADIDALAQKLNTQRIAPLAKHLDGVKTLYVVPVNQMAGIPVEVLTDKYTVSYVPSGTFLARLRDKPAPTGSALLALGDPVFARPDAKTKPAADLPPGGLLLTLVAPDGAAAKARLQHGDVIVSYAGVELTSTEKLAEAINAQAAAKEVTITVWREGVKPFTRTIPPGRLGVALAKEPAREAIADRRKTDAMLAALRGGNWKDLPGTRAEVAQLARLFDPNATVLLDGAASEQKLNALRKAGDLSKFRYLHLATHGEANDARALESVLILSQDTLPKDPLPRAGEPFINGQLSANEVLEFWDLKAELVTLSACETALGRKGGGDGLLGFAQAFLTVGSRSVCLSLWKVDDAATALLMTRFYQNLLGKRPGLDKPMSKSVALSEAKQWLRELSAEEALRLTAAATNGVVRGTRGKNEELRLVVPAVDSRQPGAKDVRPFAHPRFWAAFVLVGDPN